MSFRRMMFYSGMTGLCGAIAFDLNHPAAYIMFAVIFISWFLRMHEYAKECKAQGKLRPRRK